eukprot:6674952-Pyramimonas_sp.AAC.1
MPLLGERQAPGQAGAGCRLRQQRGPDHLDVGHERDPGDNGQRVPLPAIRLGQAGKPQGSPTGQAPSRLDRPDAQLAQPAVRDAHDGRTPGGLGRGACT